MNNFKVLVILSIASLFGLLAACSESGSSSDNGNSVTGQGGSTARMTIVDDYLYAISGRTVQLFDISDAAAPAPWVKVPVAWDIETLFPYGNYLLIGAETGMHILDNSNPAQPQYIADFTHARARDPVVAHNGYAYVTLKSDGDFFSVADQMDVINLFDIYNPTLVKTLPMQGPGGLSVDGSRLYVCDDVAGIKLFDVTDPADPVIVESIRDVNCNDVIARDGILYVITDDQLRQYDISVSPPVLLSELST